MFIGRQGDIYLFEASYSITDDHSAHLCMYTNLVGKIPIILYS